MGYGGMGYGMGGMMMGPMSIIYSINYFVAMIGQTMQMLGLGTHALGQLYLATVRCFKRLERSIRQSELRRWVQRKCQKSPFLRMVLVLSSMAAVSQLVRLIKYLIESNWKELTGGAGSGTTQMVTNAAANTGSNAISNGILNSASDAVTATAAAAATGAVPV